MFGNEWNQNRFKTIQNGAVCAAEDLTAFVSDIRSAQYLFKLLDQFKKCSGLKANYTETESMWIGSSRDNTETPLALKWRKTVKALGVQFTITKNQCKRIHTLSSEESNLRYAYGIRETSPRLVKSQLLRVYYFLKFCTSRQFFLLLWGS